MLHASATQHIPVEDTSMSWTEMGAGPPLVLLHGLQDSHRSWRRAAPCLASHFRVLMPDLPGHGWSARPDAPYTLPWFARMVAGWMEAIGVVDAHMCGHSLGGGVALWMLMQERSRIRRLALLAPGGLGREVSVWMRMAAIPVVGTTVAPPLMKTFTAALLRLFPGLVGNIEPEEVRLLVTMMSVPGTERAFARSLAGVVNVFGQHQQLLPRVREITLPPPMAVFWGNQDPIIPPHHGRRLVEHSTGISLHTYPKCGHFPQLQAPERFALDLRTFLLNPDAPPARLSPTPMWQVDKAGVRAPLRASPGAPGHPAPSW